MWDEEYYSDRNLYGPGAALVNQERRDAQKRATKNQSTYTSTGNHGPSIGGPLVLICVGLFALALLIALIEMAVEWYTSDVRHYIVTGAVIVPVLALVVRRYLRERLPMLPEVFSLGCLVALYIYVCSDCFLVTENSFSYAYLPALAAFLGCTAFLILDRLEIVTPFADRTGLSRVLLALQLMMLVWTFFILPDVAIMGALTWLGFVDQFHSYILTHALSEAQLIQIIIAGTLSFWSFGICESS